MYVYVYIYMHMCVRSYVRMYVCVYIHKHIYLYMHMYVCMYACMHTPAPEQHRVAERVAPWANRGGVRVPLGFRVWGLGFRSMPES